MSYEEKAMRDLIYKIKSSVFFLSIFDDPCKADVDVLIQFAYAIMLDKPIYMLVKEGSKLPENIRRLARGIEVFASPEDVTLAGKRLIERANNELSLHLPLDYFRSSGENESTHPPP